MENEVRNEKNKNEQTAKMNADEIFTKDGMLERRTAANETNAKRKDTSHKTFESKTNMRVRLEIIFSQAVEEDFQAAFKELGIGKRFTKFESVMGAGFSNPRLGNAVWPQLNMMYIIYCDEGEAEKIKRVIADLRKQYVTEGIACFVSSAEEV